MHTHICNKSMIPDYNCLLIYKLTETSTLSVLKYLYLKLPEIQNIVKYIIIILLVTPICLGH